MTLLGLEESSGWAVSRRSSAGVAGYCLSQVRSYGAVVAGARSVAVTGKWSEG
jgi:hypothetical protein